MSCFGVTLPCISQHQAKQQREGVMVGRIMARHGHLLRNGPSIECTYTPCSHKWRLTSRCQLRYMGLGSNVDAQPMSTALSDARGRVAAMRCTSTFASSSALACSWRDALELLCSFICHPCTHLQLHSILLLCCLH